jgi:glucose/arabinose dehydrogenase
MLNGFGGCAPSAWMAALVVLATVLPSSAAPPLRAEPYVAGLTQPIEFVQDPFDPSVKYVVEQLGRIRVIRNGALLPGDFLNLAGAISTGSERGLLGLAFPANNGASGRFYVNFTNPQGHTVVARFTRAGTNPPTADPASRFDLRWPSGNRFIVQPFANHNGGHLAFGPDGYLYIGMGDGGSGNDPQQHAQNPQSLLGKMLRIDVNVPDGNVTGYAVPPDNPFVASGFALPEIWAFGLRNPWKFSFDNISRGGTGALVIGDVGQNAWEEIDYEPRASGGRNYGWRNREGAHPNPNPNTGTPPPAYGPLTDPIFEYSHSVGNSITGGYVYRGSALGSFYKGRYFFADLSGRVWSLGLSRDSATGAATATNLLEHTAELGGVAALGNITSLGEDVNGELYVVNYSGVVLRVLARRGDYDMDGRPDFGVYAPDTGVWEVLQSSSSFTTTAGYQWGLAPGDLPVPGDYDGDGVLELAVYRPSNGTWYLYFLPSGTVAALQWGTSADVPVPRDYDGDGRTELAVWRPQTGEWFIFDLRTGTFVRYPWGLSTDMPVPGDYDADGLVDVAVWRPSDGNWYVFFSSTRTFAALPWGAGTDIPVPGDYDGDGRTDLAVWRPSTGVWWVFNLATGTFVPYQWGQNGDKPVPADYDGDGRTDLGIWRAATAEWFVYFLSSDTFVRRSIGHPGVTPLGPPR